MGCENRGLVSWMGVVGIERSDSMGGRFGSRLQVGHLQRATMEEEKRIIHISEMFLLMGK